MSDQITKLEALLGGGDGVFFVLIDDRRDDIPLAALAQLADAVPDRRLGGADLARDLVERLARVLLQLGKDFPVHVIETDRHSAFPPV